LETLEVEALLARPADLERAVEVGHDFEAQHLVELMTFFGSERVEHVRCDLHERVEQGVAVPL
jgi:hypothetical protein